VWVFFLINNFMFIVLKTTTTLQQWQFIHFLVTNYFYIINSKITKINDKSFY